MTVNKTLLERARTMGTQLAEAERQALLTRAEYHTAIRRLHLAGASLREIAEALSLSHQRIQQIVDESGGSWWRRAWRSRSQPRAAICTWCGRPPGEVDKLVAGPNVYICDSCVLATERTLRRGDAVSKGRCSFCRKRAAHDRQIVDGDRANVCRDCLQVCREIMQLDAA